MLHFSTGPLAGIFYKSEILISYALHIFIE
jgi:hypothetical protein